MADRHPAIVIGAGPAGLTAAYELSRRGVRPLVLERADKVGGIARTEVYKGYRFDIGGHRFFTQFPEVERLWHEMMGQDFIRVPRLSRIHYKGKFLQYPLSLGDTLRKLGLAESILIILSYAWAKLRPLRPEESFEQWVTNRFGARLFRTFFKTYTEKVWGIPCGVLRADWAAQRIGKLSVGRALRHALFGGRGVRTLTTEFLYPPLGPGMMWERFAGAVEAAGGTVRLNAAVTALRHEGGRVTAVVTRSGDAEGRDEGEQFLASMPLPQLVQALTPPAPDDVLRAAGALRHRSFIVVSLIVNRPDLFRDNWIYIHTPTVRVGRIQNFKNWSPRMVPDPRKTCVGMEYFCTEGDELWTMPDEELIALASRELVALGLAEPGDVEDGTAVRQPKAYPVYDADYPAALARIQAYLRGFPNLHPIGRNGLHRYDNMDQAMLSGMRGAENALGAHHDPWLAVGAQQYQEERR